MIRLTALVFAFALNSAAPVAAQTGDETLADIRQELSVLFVEVQRLKRELSTTGGPTTNVVGNTPLERIDAIEAELQRLTAKSEELEFRVNQVVTDGTKRIGDLEFRLCELEPGCDIADLPETSTLGGEDLAALPVTVPDTGSGDGSELAVGEQSDFDRAREALDSGDFRSAAEQFAAFTQTYPGGPLSAEAHFLRGQAHEGLGEMSDAARAYLESFSGAPDGQRAPEALTKLGTALGTLGQTNEACVTLGEVETRFPTSAMVAQAQASMRNLGCN